MSAQAAVTTASSTSPASRRIGVSGGRIAPMTALALALRPFATLLLWVAIVIPLSLLAYRLIPKGKIKDALFKRREAPWDE